MTSAKPERLSWLLYDFANNSFSVMIITFVYPVYFKRVVCAGLGDRGDLLWGINGSASLILVALLSPVLGAALTTSKAIFWTVSLAGALCLASIQAVSRSMVALMVRREQQGEVFGFYGISGKFSSVVGPLLFGLISFLSGSQRLAMLSIGALFLLGLLLLLRVDELSRPAEASLG